jgi:MFS family permease
VLTFGLMTALLASGYGVVFTVLDDFRDEYGIAEFWLGLIVGIGFLAGFLSQVFIAPFADRGHARRLVLLGLILSVGGLVAMAFGESLLPILAGRFVMGLGTGMAVPAVRRIVINGDPGNLGKNLGLLLAADVAGFATGPALSALLVPEFGLAVPFLVIAGATLCYLPMVLRVPVVEGVLDGDLSAAEAAARPPRLALDLLQHRALVAALMMGAAVFLMIGTFDALWALVLDDLDASEFVANVGITIFALPLVFLGSYGGSLAQRVGPFRLGPLGLALGAGFMFLYGFMPTGVLMLTVGVIHAVSDGLTVSSTGVAVAISAPAERQAGAQGLLGAAETLSGGVTAVLAGALYAWGGRALAYSTCSVLMLALVAGSWALAGPEFRARRGVVGEPVVPTGDDLAEAAISGRI